MTDAERRKAHEALFFNIGSKLDKVDNKIDSLLKSHTTMNLDFSLKLLELEKDKASKKDVDDLNQWKARWAGVCIGLSLTATLLTALTLSLKIFGD